MGERSRRTQDDDPKPVKETPVRRLERAPENMISVEAKRGEILMRMNSTESRALEDKNRVFSDTGIWYPMKGRSNEQIDGSHIFIR